MEMPKFELTLEELYRTIGELEVTRRKQQEFIAKVVQESSEKKAPLDFPRDKPAMGE